LDDVEVAGLRLRRVAAVEVHRAEVRARAGVVGLEFQVALEERDGLAVLVAVVVDVCEAAQAVGVLRIELEDVLVGGDRGPGVGVAGSRTSVQMASPAARKSPSVAAPASVS